LVLAKKNIANICVFGIIGYRRCNMKKTKNGNNIVQMPIRAYKTEQEWFNLHVDQALHSLSPVIRDFGVIFIENLDQYVLENNPYHLIGPVFFDYNPIAFSAMVQFDFNYEEDPLHLLMKNYVSLYGIKTVKNMVKNYFKQKKLSRYIV
jgi:hypothetical protein